MLTRILSASFVAAMSLSALSSSSAFADGAAVGANANVNVSIKLDVNVKAQAQAAAGDAAYAAGNFQAALAAYGQGFAQSRDAAFIYAMARCHAALGRKDEAEAMFKMYLSASGGVTLKYKGEAEAELKGKAGGVIHGLGSVVGKVKDDTVGAVKIVGDFSTGVYTVAKVNIAAKVDVSIKAKVDLADKAYAAGKFGEAAAGYLEAFATAPKPELLYGAAQAHAQAGLALQARGEILGYLAAQPNGAYANEAKNLALALGTHASAAVKVAVATKVDVSIKSDVKVSDDLMAAGKYSLAIKAYADAYAKKAEPALLYAKGLAQFYSGQAADAAVSLKAYLAAGGNLDFKVQADTALKLCAS